MAKEKLVIVNKEDRTLGIKTRENCHKNNGVLHRAVTIFIFNDKEEVLITKRSKQKQLWPEFWETSCSTHVYEDETYERAGERRLPQELGINCKLKFLFKFQYQAKYKKVGSENEICAVLVGEYNKKIKPNLQEVINHKWISFSSLQKDIQKNPKKYAPWMRVVIAQYSSLLSSHKHLLSRRAMNEIISLSRDTSKKVYNYIEKYGSYISSIDKNFANLSFYGVVAREKTPKPAATFIRLIYQTLKNSNDWERVLPLTACSEMWTVAAYTIDDILDKQPIREHITATWKKFGIERGIITGIIQREIAEKCLLDLKINEKQFLEIFKLFIKIQIFVYYGQYLIEELAHTNKLNETNYFKRTKYVAFDVAPFAKMSAIVANTTHKEQELAYNIGGKYSMAIMIRNDLLDVLPEEIVEQKSKMAARISLEDLRKGLLTYPLILLAEKSNENKKFVNSLKGKQNITKKQKITLIKKLLTSSAIDATLDLITKYKNDTITFINQLKPSQYRDQLIAYTNQIENTRFFVQELRLKLKIF